MVRDARAEAQDGMISTEVLDAGHCPWFKPDSLQKIVQAVKEVATGPSA